MKKVLVVVALGVLGAFLSVACGGGTTETAPPASPTGAEPTAPAAGDADAGAVAAPAAS